MNKFLCIAALLLCGSASGQQWQQRVDHEIAVALDSNARNLEGFERIVYHNHSPDTLRFIWFHLWPNAYKNDRTALADQQLRNGNTDVYFLDKEERGYINRLDFRVNGSAARTEDHPEHIDIVKLLLPKPLAPGDTALITTPFHVKLPLNVSRGGYWGKHMAATQWYPKPAVYDQRGWHPMPYLDQGEFYNEFGNYEVYITTPATFKVAATGVPVPPIANSALAASDAAAGKATVHFRQQHVTDFAWFAATDWIVKSDTCALPSGRTITVNSFYTAAEKKQWDSSLLYAKRALRFYSAEVGEYPYDQMSIVLGPAAGAGGGMEYPGVTLIAPAESGKALDITIAHEIGHNWFQGALANNERDEPWMDEGLNTFYERKYTRAVYGNQPQLEELLFLTLAHQKRDQPITTVSDSFHQYNYALVAYYKTARWMEALETAMGRDSLHSRMQRWWQTNKFHHVSGTAFRTFIDPGANAAASDQAGQLPSQQLKGTKLISPLLPTSIGNYLQRPSKHAWIVSPALGANEYDKLMMGALITNWGLPPSKLQVLAAPLYATGSKQWNGLGRLSYSQYFDRGPKKLQLFVAGSTFSQNAFTDEKGIRLTSRFSKIVPGAELSFRNRDLRSTRFRTIQWKSFFIGEEPFRIGLDTVVTGTDTALLLSGGKASLNYSIHQLRFELGDFRSLYPYRAAAWIQHSEYFTRVQVEGNYFFNYARGGGLDVRVFGGKYFYDNKRSDYPYGFNPARYWFNMSGAGGDEDYTYSHYFAGRNEFEGLASQQIAIRDGGFKIRTPLLSDPVGRSDDWLAALNFNTSIPDKLNPLSVLPIRIPVHLFFDIGTYSGAWRSGASGDRFLFDAGLHLPVLQGTVNIYFPIVYSGVYREYVNSIYTKNRFFKTMTFSIDLEKATRFFKQQMLF